MAAVKRKAEGSERQQQGADEKVLEVQDVRPRAKRREARPGVEAEDAR